MLVGHEREPTTSASPDRGIVVAGAFTGGGAQARSRAHRNAHELEREPGVDARGITWCRRASSCPTGAGAASTIAPTSAARSTSAGLDAYAAGQPYAFTQQQGNGDLALLEKQVGAYIKDDWQVAAGPVARLRPALRLAELFSRRQQLRPARSRWPTRPGNKKTNVLRAGIGVFNDRSGPVVIADVLHSQPGGLTRIVITDPGYPDPFAIGAAAASQPPSIVRLAPDVQIPQTLQYSVGLDHQLQKTTTVSVTYTGARGYQLFRSRDVNAPLPPLYLRVRIRRTASFARSSRPAARSSDSLQIDAARPGDALVQRPDAVHAEPRRQRHERHQRVSGERLRPVGRMGARGFRSAASVRDARHASPRSRWSISAWA